MRKYNLIIAGVAFIICLVSAYFGVRIYNANENFLITDLNEFDKIYHDDINLVPKLSKLAALITLPLISIILVLEVLVLRTAKVRQSKNIAIGLMIAAVAVLVVDILTISNPIFFDFSKWGFVWICMGLFLMAGNVLSYFISRFGKQ
jgi:hypothetical protein